MKSNCCWVNYEWVTTQNQIVILETKSKQYYTCQVKLLKNWNASTGVDTSTLAAKKDLIVFEVEVDKLEITELVHVRTE